MHDIRESFFECLFESASGRRVGHIAAWDEKEAVQLFEIELRADGVDDEGDVVVSPMRGDRRAPTRAHLPKHRAA